jgi:RNA polymerase sigma-70 factor (ECF subfamily)
LEKYCHLSDNDLIRLLNKGDEAAYKLLYDRYWPVLYESAYNILRDRNSSMDLLQEIFVWLWVHRKDLRINNLRGYLLSAVKFKIANYFRDNKVRNSIFAELEIKHLNDIPFYDDSLEVKELKEIIIQFTSQLPQRAKQIFHLSRIEHLSNKEVAQRLGISEKTVENQMTTNLRKLRLKMGRMSAWMIFYL